MSREPTTYSARQVLEALRAAADLNQVQQWLEGNYPNAQRKHDDQTDEALTPFYQPKRNPTTGKIGELVQVTRRELLIELGLFCPTCHGDGEIPYTIYATLECPTCGGYGYNPETVERLAKALWGYATQFTAWADADERTKEWGFRIPVRVMLDELQVQPDG